MTKDECATHHIDVADLESGKILLHKGISSDAKDMGEVGIAMEVLTRVDLDLAYSSEKLVNLDTILMHLLAWENDFEAMAAKNDNISVEAIEKALTVDLLSGYLDSEVGELDNFMGSLEAQIVDARHKISSRGHLRELFIVVYVKLHDSEESLKQSQEHVLELKMQLAKLQMTSLALNHNDWKHKRDINLPENFQVANIDVKSQMQTIEQRRILRMLEKSLARELDLEKKLTDLKQNEEDLKLKLHLTEQVSFCMEEAAEVVWGRFLEAENAAEVLMGISKGLVGRFQIGQFNLNSSIQQEEEMKSKLQDCIEQLKSKETVIQTLNSSIVQLIAENSEVVTLKEKVKLLEKQLRESGSQLEKANASNEASEEQLRETDGIIESLKENIYVAENRAESAETKIAQLTDANLELTEELGFIKGSNESNTQKVGLLEKQLRELEHQLQQARVSSEASQEQQNMLYSAIWDMETLIDELKQKVSNSESKTENAEEQCVSLSETNFEINKELDFLRARLECLETSLSQANDEKLASAKDINIKTNLIMDMVMQLAMERERVQKRLYSLTGENKMLMKKLRKIKKDGSIGTYENGGGDNNNFPSSRVDSTNAVCKETSNEAATELSSERFQVEKLSNSAPTYETELESSNSANNATNLVLKLESESLLKAKKPNRTRMVMAILVLLLSVLAAYLFKYNYSIFNAFVD